MALESGYAPVNGGEMYWESRGDEGTPLVLVHGGYGLASDFASLGSQWAEGRRDRSGGKSWGTTSPA